MPRTRLIKRKGPRRKGKPHTGDRHFGQHVIEERQRQSELSASRAIVRTDDTEFINIGEREGYTYGAPRLSEVKGLEIHLPVIPRPARTKRAPETLVHYSQEAINHANYLLNTQGKDAMDHYLKGAKMSTQPNLVTDRRSMEEVQAGGTIETAIREAEAKIAHHQSRASFHESEQQRWTTVASSLRTALEATNATYAPKPNGNGHAKRNGHNEERPRGFWRELFRTVGAGKIPLSRKDWTDKLHAASGAADRSTTYAAVGSAIKKGDLLDVGEGLYGLAEWTTPGAA
jgi:hypothetical protein